MYDKIPREKMLCQLTLLAVLLSSTAGGAAAQERPEVTHFSVRWQNLPLRAAVERLRDVAGASVFLDRRVDPDRRISLTVANVDINDVLTNLSNSSGLGHAQLGRLHYLGPRDTAHGLSATAAARRKEVAALNSDLRSGLTGRRRLVWPRLAEPRGLIVQLVEQHGWQIANAELISHDLWAAGEMPAMPLADQLTVLLAGFNLTYRLEPKAHTIVLMPAVWPKAAPPGLPRRPIRPDPPGSRTPSKQVFTLRVANQPLGRVLDQLAQRLDWKLDIDEEAIRAAGLSMERLVSFEVQNADQQELLSALLEPAGLAATQAGNVLRIAPK